MSEWNLEEYLSHGVERIIKGILKASLQNPKESIFMMQYAKDSRRAREIRRTQEEDSFTLMQPVEQNPARFRRIPIPV
ncbi:hypothetical protein [Faecalicatena contorta]|uniref:hypothetical protein n=1 Tax=Faecalicatena contorta TaxID=39482 RepID=UPI001F20CDD3|nr:hypothetical protein [Faecalicatena contorta]MCF2684119.1 hypothetical protein [Faecalicatena contorta]